VADGRRCNRDPEFGLLSKEEEMELLDYLHKLFSYDDWANREVVRALQTLDTPPARSRKLTAHILGTEYVWLARIQRQASPLAVWPDLSLADCEQHAHQIARLWSDYLANTNAQGMTRVIGYKNSKGESWSNSIQDILMHVVMHSAYHRGQIAADMRAAGHTPAYTDFIYAVRQQMME
jgi:uncharacterized damage-inducible protein DinB